VARFALGRRSSACGLHWRGGGSLREVDGVHECGGPTWGSYRRRASGSLRLDSVLFKTLT
jgi:hypothetical protein